MNRIGTSAAAGEVLAIARRASPMAVRTSAAHFIERGGRIVAETRHEVPQGSISRRAEVSMPLRGDGAIAIRDDASGLAIQVRLADAKPSSAEAAAGHLVYADVFSGNEAGNEARTNRAHLLIRAHSEGAEDSVVFEEAPTVSELRYDVTLGEKVRALRLVDDVLEFVDAAGAPRLRMRRPFVMNGGQILRAHVTVLGCTVDTDGRPPWGRPMPAPVDDSPAERRCTVKVEWPRALSGPLVVDPDWVTTGSFIEPRAIHQTAPLGNARALIVGGSNGASLIKSAEIFDSATGVFASTTPSPSDIFVDNTAAGPWGLGYDGQAVLNDGRALVTSSNSGAAGPLLSFDPQTATWATIVDPAPSAAMTVLAGGRVAFVVATTPEKLTFYDPVANTWSGPILATSLIAGGRWYPRGAALPGDKLLTMIFHTAGGTPVECDPDTLSCSVLGPAVPPNFSQCYPSSRTFPTGIYCLKFTSYVWEARAFPLATGVWADVSSAFAVTLQGANPNYWADAMLGGGHLVRTYLHSSTTSLTVQPTDTVEPLLGLHIHNRTEFGHYSRVRLSRLTDGGSLITNLDLDFQPKVNKLIRGCNHNGVADLDTESCDGNDLRGQTCMALGFKEGNLACSPECTFDVNECVVEASTSAGPTSGSGTGGAGTGGAGGVGGALSVSSSGTSSSNGGAGATSSVSSASSASTSSSMSSSTSSSASGTSSTSTGGAPSCSQPPTPLSPTLPFTMTLPETTFGFTFAGTGVELALGGAVKSTGGTPAEPCKTATSAEASLKSCVSVLGAKECTNLSGSASGECSFEQSCFNPPKAECNRNEPICCKEEFKVEVTKSYPFAPRLLQAGPLACDAGLELSIGVNLTSTFETGNCSCEGGKTTIGGNLLGRSTASFTGCRATLFGKTWTFKPVDGSLGACVSIGGDGEIGCGNEVQPDGSAGISAKVKVKTTFGFFAIEPWETKWGGSIRGGTVSSEVTCF